MYSCPFPTFRDRVACHPTTRVILSKSNKQIIYGVADAQQSNVGLQLELWVWIRTKDLARDQRRLRGAVKGLNLGPFQPGHIKG
jgi:hypothetical protein